MILIISLIILTSSLTFYYQLSVYMHQPVLLLNCLISAEITLYRRTYSLTFGCPVFVGGENVVTSEILQNSLLTIFRFFFNRQSICPKITPGYARFPKVNQSRK